MNGPSGGGTPEVESDRVLREEIVYTTPWFDLVSREVEGHGVHYVVEANDYVIVLAQSNEGILLVRQFRPAVNAHTLELPAGHVDAGETPSGRRSANCSRRRVTDRIVSSCWAR